MYIHVHVGMRDCYCMFPHMQTIGGVLEEFIFAPRIDNQLNCYAGLEVHTRVRVWAHMHTHMDMCTRVCTCAHTHAHACSHTHARA